MSLDFKLKYQPAFFACLLILTGAVPAVSFEVFELQDNAKVYVIIATLSLGAIWSLVAYRAKRKLKSLKEK